MIISIQPFSVTKRHPLTISRGTSAGSENLLVQLEHDGIQGFGEMAPTSGGAVAETAESATSAIHRWSDLLESFTPWDAQEMEAALNQQFGNRANLAARAALDMALWDWRGKALEMPVWRLMGLSLDRVPATSVTIGINPPEIVFERVQETLLRTHARHLKVKLGSKDGAEVDQSMFTAAQEAAAGISETLGFSPSWRVDANGGWTVETAVMMSEWLKARGTEYIEQPLARGNEARLAELHSRTALPIYADESIYLAEDIPALAEHIDGVNLKLMKCGGITEALRIVHTARAHHLRVMYGCMSETSLAISAAAEISPLADDVDLDSHLNLLPDPYCGAELLYGRVVPTDGHGLGVTARSAQ